MKCPDIGMLRAHIDGELAAREAGAIAGHMAECERCRAEVAQLRETAASVKGCLDYEGGAPAEPNLAGLRQRLRATEERTAPAALWHWLSASPWGRLAGSASAVVVLAALVALTPMRLAAEDLLAVFRVQQFEAVTIDVGTFPMLPGANKALAGVSLPAMVPPTVKEVSAAEAAAGVDFAVRRPQYLPASLSGQSRTLLSSPVEYTYTVKLAEVQKVLEAVGGEGIELPQGLDGATIRASMPGTIATLYGGIVEQPGGTTAGTDYLILVQTRGPTLEIPDSVDVDALRDTVLSLPLLPADLVRQLRAVKDWRHTLIIPVPTGANKNVTVAGVPGLFIAADQETSTLLWQKAGVLYGLIGSVSESEMMRIANSVG